MSVITAERDLLQLRVGLLLALTCVSLGAPPACCQSNLIHLSGIAADPNAAAGEIDGLAFSADGRLLAVSDNLATAHLYDITDPRNPRSVGKQFRHAEITFEGKQKPGGEMNAAAFSPNGKWLATGIDGGGAKLWSVDSQSSVAHLDDATNCDAVALSPDGKWLASASGNRLMLRPVDGDTGRVGKPILSDPHGDAGEVNSIDWSSDGTILVSGGLRLVRVYKVDSHGIQLLHNIPNRSQNGSVKSVRISPDNAVFAMGARDERSQVLDLATGRLVMDLRHEGNRTPLPGDDQDKNVAIEAVEWSSDANYLFTSGLVDGVLRIWRRDDWSLVGWAQAQGVKRAIEIVAVNGSLVAVGGDEGVANLYEFRPPPVYGRYEFLPDERVSLVIEAEDFDTNLGQGGHHWKVETDTKSSNGRFVHALPEDGAVYQAGFQTFDPAIDSPRLDYRVTVVPAGNYYLWVRGRGKGPRGNSISVGHSSSDKTATNLRFEARTDWKWAKEPFSFDEAREYTLNIWMGGAGVAIDKFVITSDGAFDAGSTAGGQGPSNSSVRRSPAAKLKRGNKAAHDTR